MKPYVSAIIPSAGSGKRMNSEIKKQFLKIENKEIVTLTLEKFQDSPIIDEIIVVTSVEDIIRTEELVAKNSLTKVVKIVAGGSERQDSIQNGLDAISPETTIVLVHDGARPFVTEDIIGRCVQGVINKKAVIAAVPIKDTIKKVHAGGCVSETLKRHELWSIQTPQGFSRELIIRAYNNAREHNFHGTDDASLLEFLGAEVTVIEGSYENIKITTSEDLLYGEFLMEKNEEAVMRVGMGYDVHRLVPERKLILGGVEIPYKLGLLGHSDADVLLHAIMDAILGAVGLGDIGRHFPDNALEFKDISSMILLKRVMDTIKAKGYVINNLDCTIIAEKPKMMNHLQDMKYNISEVLEVAVECINIKATTTEKLGFVGREEGIAAEAIVSVVSDERGA